MKEGVKGGGIVGVGDHHHQIQAAADDMGDGMQCSDHPYRNNPSGICAFCLQEKLGKLVSSSFPLPIRASSSSSSSSPSFRSDIGGGGSGNGVTSSVASSTSLSLSLSSVRPTSARSTRNDNGNANNDGHYQEYYTRRVRIPFLLAKKKKKIMEASSDHAAADIVFKRSKSTAAPRRGHFLDATDDAVDFSPRKRGGFWSFLYHSSRSHTTKKMDKITTSTAATTTAANGHSSRSNTTKKMDKITTLTAATTTAANGANGSHLKSRERCLGSSMSKKGADIVIEVDDSPNSQATGSAASSFERKVSRSRSVGCGSRSFSGDFFERISTGFGDCTLRRVESQREGKPKVNAASSSMKERVKCGGIFGGFIITSSSSSSSSSSYWVSSSVEDHANGKSADGPLTHGRSKSWVWAFASPMRASGKPSSSRDGRRDHIIKQSVNKNTTPNLNAIPSLLAVRG